MCVRSAARGEDRAASDVDLLVETEDDRSLPDLVGLEPDLEDLLRRDVDVVTDASVPQAFVRGSRRSQGAVKDQRIYLGDISCRPALQSGDEHRLHAQGSAPPRDRRAA